VQLAYAIGIAKPISIYINTFGTGKVSDEKIALVINKIFDLTPEGMIKKFDLLNSKLFRKLPKTFFLDMSYPWEKADKIKELKKALAIK
jgi:S-adenosylmethionine synthetase